MHRAKRAEPASESPSAFGRRVGASRQCVTRAIHSRRLNSSVRRVDGQWRIDVEAGLQEWECNRSRLARPSEVTRRRCAVLAPPDRFSVARIADVICLSIFDAADEPVTFAPMADDTAIAIASRLLELAGYDIRETGGETDAADVMKRTPRGGAWRSSESPARPTDNSGLAK